MLRVLNYSKRLGVIVAGVLLATSLGLSSVASGVVPAGPGVNAGPGFNASGRGLNRTGPILPRPPLNTPTVTTPIRGQLPTSPIASPPIFNPAVR